MSRKDTVGLSNYAGRTDLTICGNKKIIKEEWTLDFLS